MVAELAHYHRGREHGAVFAIIRDELQKRGARTDQVAHFEEPRPSRSTRRSTGQRRAILSLSSISVAMSNIQEKHDSRPWLE